MQTSPHCRHHGSPILPLQKAVRNVSKINACHFALRNAPFRIIKRAVSPPETARFKGQNGTSCNPADYQRLTEVARPARPYIKKQRGSRHQPPPQTMIMTVGQTVIQTPTLSLACPQSDNISVPLWLPRTRMQTSSMRPYSYFHPFFLSLKSQRPPKRDCPVANNPQTYTTHCSLTPPNTEVSITAVTIYLAMSISHLPNSFFASQR